MLNIGIDVHRVSSQVCMFLSDGKYREKRIPTTRDSFAKELKGVEKSRIVIEASTESEWVAQCLEELGHEVVVAEPNFAPMYASRTRRIKTDRRDARALYDACRLGAYRAAYRPPAERRHERAMLRVRQAKYVTLSGSLVRREGYRQAPGTGGKFPEWVERLELPEHLNREIQPLIEAWQLLTVQFSRS